MDTKNVWAGLAYGGIASMFGDLVTMPIDVTKTRLQLSGAGGGKSIYKGALDCALTTLRGEGIGALWKGLEPALWRQASYGSLKYGLYTPIKNALMQQRNSLGRSNSNSDKDSLPLWVKIAAGGLSGTIAQGLANPTDLVKVRMMADGMKINTKGATLQSATRQTLSKPNRQILHEHHLNLNRASSSSSVRIGVSHSGSEARYRSFWGAVIKIGRNEGFASLYQGLGPNVSRAAVLTAAELASYDHVKQVLKRRFGQQDGLGLHTQAALSAGFVSAFCANPFDLVKSRMMNATKGQYTGMKDCFIQTVRHEGFTSLWKGFIPNWTRIGPRVVVVFVVMEQLRACFG